MAEGTKFMWKRKTCDNVNKNRLKQFSEETEETNESYLDDWRLLTKKIKSNSLLEDASVKSDRLKSEGIALAELQRYWEAISKWNEAISLTPNNDILHEMKAQVLMELNEIFPAIQSAEKAVSLNSQIPENYQTLGRAQLAIGEIHMAIQSFSKALHLRPDCEELWNEDLNWAKELRQKNVQR